MCNSDKLVIAFRGTEFTLVDGIGIDDIITDLDVKDRDPRTVQVRAQHSRPSVVYL